MKRAAAVALGLAGLCCAACASARPEYDEDAIAKAVRPPAQAPQSWHRGPPVATSETLVPAGPARFLAPLQSAFERAEAMGVLRALDAHYRAPANEGYELALARVERELRAAGFGGDARLRLERLTSEQPVQAWTPRRARLELLLPGRAPELLLAFEAPADETRTMLPTGARSGSCEGALAFSAEQLDGSEARVLISAQSSQQLWAAARGKPGLLALLSASLEDYNRPPERAAEWARAIQFTRAPAGADVPVLQISPRVLDRLRAAGPAARVRLSAEVETSERPLEHLVATVLGERQPGDAIAIAAHVQEPGANDNASGVAGMTEAAAALARTLGSGALRWPGRSIAFVFGQEIEQSRVYLERGGRRVVAGLAADMLGESREHTGAIALLERGPDPGCEQPLPPDEASGWSDGPSEAPRGARPDGLAIVARCALVDVGLLAKGWECADHAFEGGSDHAVFAAAGLPGALFWHFPDFTYHTSLDRSDRVDPRELERSSLAVLGCALALASANATDLTRYLHSLRLEIELRCAAARAAGQPELEQRWRAHGEAARHWLRALCLWLPAGAELAPTSAPASAAGER